jgi:hypothetical protein
MIRVLVCGGRDYTNRRILFDALDRIAERHNGVHVIQGGATGADALAREWCRERMCSYSHYPADWRAHGRSAGPIRNKQMLDEGRPHVVVAFPGGRSTADMIRQAEAAAVAVERIP